MKKFESEPAVRRTAEAIARSRRARVLLTLGTAWVALTCALTTWYAFRGSDLVIALLLAAGSLYLVLVLNKLIRLHRLVNSARRTILDDRTET